MTWWLKAAEELRTLRQLGIARPGSVISGFILDAPTVTIEGEATEVPPSAADQPADSPALSLPPPLEPAAPALPVVQSPPPAEAPRAVPEIGGRKDGTDPTRFGDWEKNGRCIDF